ncbi:class I SAM-dependent methyltransferase [Pseudalkalibacillus sp. Hm43]|uniref:class I SAM-dependent methyltransferase n=1 Tax=Pseudalkalibacillus sp. Hm43 TaxID=3450742 RepID=UPI003F4288E6
MDKWNRFVYKLWSPVYDKFFNTGQFLKARKEVFQDQRFHEGQEILFVGVGTGADLELINYEVMNITAIDYSNDMLNKAKTKFKGTSIEFLKMDAQDMSFPDHQFDVVVASLVLSVVPDTKRCLEEMVRVLKPQGTIIVFDKFAPKHKGLSFLKKALRPFIKLLGTDIGINFEKLYAVHKDGLLIREEEPLMFNGMYMKIILQKKD